MNAPNPLAGRRLLARLFRARLHLLLAALAGGLVFAALPEAVARHAVTRAMIGWNVGAGLYLAMAARMMFRSTHEHMRTRALQQDEGRRTVMALVVLAAIAALGAVVMQLSLAKDLQGPARHAHVALAGLTIASSWAFTQVMFALHYAHDYYAVLERDHVAGLAFPGSRTPDYGDFLHFSCVIGTSAQTADVSFMTRAMRRTGTVHCVLAFFFNTTLIAVTINVASGLI
jgi:uncharacterized membrane protein